jgi:protoporphyrinogen oxidase
MGAAQARDFWGAINQDREQVLNMALAEPKKLKNQKPAKVVILGGGLTGMSAGLRLQEAGPETISEIVILEQELRPGGLLQTTQQNGHWWDNGVFYFRWENYLRQLLPEVLQPIPGGMLQRAWLAGSLRDFPLDKGLLRTLSKTTLLGIACDYLYSYIRCSLGWDGKNLRDWLRYRLTARLLNLSRLDLYVTKMQGLPVTQLSPILGERRLDNIHHMTRPGRLMRIILFSSQKIREEMQQHNPDIYPFQGGVGVVSQKLAELCEARGIRLICGARVQRLLRRGDAGYEIHYESPHGPGGYQADYVISTFPLEELAGAARDQISDQAWADAQDLSYLDLKLVFLLVKRPRIIHEFFVLYSFEPHHPWKRLLALALPEGLTALTVEVGFQPGSAPPGPEVDDLIIRQLTGEVQLFHPEEIVARHSALVHRAYPVYKLGFEAKVEGLIKELESPRLRLAGRQGRFLYVTTPGAIASAHAAADQILSTLG